LRLRFSIRVKHEPTLTGVPTSVERTIETPARDGIIIGRRAGADIQLPFATVSGEHARLFRRSDGWCVEDLASSNGTFLAARRLLAGRPEAIAAGDVIRAGSVEVFFHGGVDADENLDLSGTATLARRLVHDLFQALPPAEKPRLLVVAGPAAGRELSLSASARVMKVGRADGCDWVLPDNDLSREHAAFERGADGILVRDLGSKNGLLVDGQPVAGSLALHDGQVVVLGNTSLQVVDPEERYLRQMELPGLGVVEAAVGPLTAQGPDPSRLPVVAAAIAATTLLVCLGLVLALVCFANV
jgi:pSer/pThr/pTyr-binding forkhead associated (FHA) protein